MNDYYKSHFIACVIKFVIKYLMKYIDTFKTVMNIKKII